VFINKINVAFYEVKKTIRIFAKNFGHEYSKENPLRTNEFRDNSERKRIGLKK